MDNTGSREPGGDRDASVRGGKHSEKKTTAGLERKKAVRKNVNKLNIKTKGCDHNSEKTLTNCFGAAQPKVQKTEHSARGTPLPRRLGVQKNRWAKKNREKRRLVGRSRRVGGKKAPPVDDG